MKRKIESNSEIAAGVTKSLRLPTQNSEEPSSASDIVFGTTKPSQNLIGDELKRQMGWRGSIEN